MYYPNLEHRFWDVHLRYVSVLDDQVRYYNRVLVKKWQVNNRNFRRLFDYGVFKMASKRRSSTDTSWINVNLTADDKDEVKNADIDPVSIIQALDDLTAAGYSFNIRNKGENIIAMAFKVADDDESTNLGISAFADTLDFSLHVLLYKMLVKLDGQWTSDLSEARTNRGGFG